MLGCTAHEMVESPTTAYSSLPVMVMLARCSASLKQQCQTPDDGLLLMGRTWHREAVALSLLQLEAKTILATWH